MDPTDQINLSVHFARNLLESASDLFFETQFKQKLASAASAFKSVLGKAAEQQDVVSPNVSLEGFGMYLSPNHYFLEYVA